MHREVVERRCWIGENQFLRALNFCMLLPDGGLDLFALLSAGVALVLLQKFHAPVHYLVPLGATAGVIWRLVVSCRVVYEVS
jgi:hypothetical protein